MIIAFLIWAIVATVVALYLYDLTVRRYKVARVKMDELLEQSQERTQQLEINLHNANSHYEESQEQLKAAQYKIDDLAIQRNYYELTQLQTFEQLKDAQERIEEIESDTKNLRHLYKSTRIALDKRDKQLAHAESWKARYRKQIQQLKDQKP
jgi:chromosome segregation ATPase